MAPAMDGISVARLQRLYRQLVQSHLTAAGLTHSCAMAPLYYWQKRSTTSYSNVWAVERRVCPLNYRKAFSYQKGNSMKATTFQLLSLLMLFCRVIVYSEASDAIRGGCPRDYTPAPLVCTTPSSPPTPCVEDYPNSAPAAAGPIQWSFQNAIHCDKTGTCSPISIAGTTAAGCGT